MPGSLGSWPWILVIFSVGYVFGRVRPFREWRRINCILKSAERLGRRDRIRRVMR
jgi:hypothetical protein